MVAGFKSLILCRASDQSQHRECDFLLPCPRKKLVVESPSRIPLLGILKPRGLGLSGSERTSITACERCAALMVRLSWLRSSSSAGPASFPIFTIRRFFSSSVIDKIKQVEGRVREERDEGLTSDITDGNRIDGQARSESSTSPPDYKIS